MEDIPPGFRFYPTEEELVSFYLRHKLEREREDLNRLMDRVIPMLDIYEFDPWDLPHFSLFLGRRDPEQWFFFSPRQVSEARGGRPRRLTANGYWKATGTPGCVYSSNNRPIGVKRTMVFYHGKAPSGRKTEWKLNEYKAIDEASSSNGATPTLRHAISLCRLYKKAKCLRSFDRRPPAEGERYDEPAAARQAQATVEAAASQHQSPQMAAEITMSSTEGSSSGEHGNQSQTGKSGKSSAMVVDNDEFCSSLDEFWDSIV